MSWWERVTQWQERHGFAIDLVVMSLSAPLVLLVAWGINGSRVDALLAAGMWVPLGWRRRSPVVAVATVFFFGMLCLPLNGPVFFPGAVAVPVALYSVTLFGPVWAHRAAIGSAALGSITLGLIFGIEQLTSAYGSRASAVVVTILTGGFTLALCVATWAFALTRRSRREMIAALRDRAERLETERDQQAVIAAAAERTRIAREMHDIVAHSLSVVVAQADGGRYAAAADPDAAVRALTTIAETSRAALADMRRLLGVLREPPEPRTGAIPTVDPSSTLAPSTPQPAEHDLEQLVEQVRSSGVRASLVRMGTARRLPPGMGLTVYRICQEALTNVLKHAGPSPTVTVLVQWAARSLVVEIADDGRGASAESDGLGHGLLGMRERAAMFGGTVSSGPRPGGGFRVRAELPLPAAPAA
ncbi:sensor histidine kinase [Cellulomonas sp. NPDC089187]|uniref:sensor histidine kinase n=1 Tax=Cellulomonas sp. NPDC089187 TaxID=3154970 RepID=UPI003432DF21